MAAPAASEFGHSSWASILAVAVPSVIQSIAAPLTSTLQTAWLGQHGSVGLAAFTAVNTSATFAIKIFVFFTDGVAAKIGNAAGSQDWQALRKTAALSLAWSSSLGVLAGMVLLGIRSFVIHQLFDLDRDVLLEAASYWTVRAIGVPIAMANMACSGILQGTHHVTLCAALNTAQAVAESALSAAVLLAGWRWGSATALVSVGWIGVVTQLLLLAVSLGALPSLIRALECESTVRGVEDMTAALVEDHEWGALATDPGHEARPDLDGAKQQPSVDEHVDGEGNASAGVLESARDGLPGCSFTAPAASFPDPDAAERHRTQETGGQPPHTCQRSHSSRAFLSDGVNMLLRSVTLQATFFAALSAASKLGTPALAAHAVISQFWMLSAYAVDGFAAAGIVLGSRLAGAAARADGAEAALHALRRLVRRCCVAGTAFGAATGVTYFAARPALVTLFTADLAAAEMLSGPVWVLLACMQPINGLVFVLDGLMYASHNFAYVRDYMALGFVAVFAPALSLELLVWPGLLGIWGAKAAYNFWRAAGGLHLVFDRFLEEVAQRVTVQRRDAAAIIYGRDHV